MCIVGSILPQYPAAGPFTQLIYKNINVPVYTTLKGVSVIIIEGSLFLCFNVVNIWPGFVCTKITLVVFYITILSKLL